MHKIYTLLLLIISFEASLRFLSLRFCPFYIRFFYAIGLLSENKFEEWRLISSRVQRSGFKSYKKLLKHYSKISGTDIQIIKKLCDGMKPWSLKKRGEYSSGFHGLIKQDIKFPFGLYPKPNQNLKSLNIDSYGRRITSSKPKNKNYKKVFNVFVLGGSCIFGVGSTKDSKTICSRIEHYLNSDQNNRDKFYKVFNYGFLGYNSYQEMLALSLIKDKIDHIIVLDGWNELDQYQEETKLPLIMNGLLKNNLKINLFTNLINKIFKKSQIIKLIYQIYLILASNSSRDKSINTENISNIYPHF